MLVYLLACGTDTVPFEQGSVLESTSEESTTEDTEEITSAQAQGSGGVLIQSTANSVDSLSAGDLVVSEIMHDPDAVLDYRGEWFEIYNASSDSVDLNGLVVEDASGQQFTVGSSVVVAASGYVVLGTRINTGQNLSLIHISEPTRPL